MSDITYFLCGGTGINIGVKVKKGAKTTENKNAKMVGLDSSDRNDSVNLFPVERLEATEGSGKDRGKHFDDMIPFVEAALHKHKPSKYNIVVANSSGGTGSGLAILVCRHLIKNGHIAMLCLVNDHTSLVEKELAITGLQSFANQVGPKQLNAPICYLEYANTEDLTRGEVDEQIIGGLNLASLFFSGTNSEMDYEDLKRVFFYSARGKVNPALSRITFFDQASAPEYDGKPPVAVASLFKTSDEIKPMFVGSFYRTTGVFGTDSNLPKSLSQLHMVLDHGEALVDLETELESLASDKSQAAVTFTKQKDVSEGSNDFGVVL